MLLEDLDSTAPDDIEEHIKMLKSKTKSVKELMTQARAKLSPLIKAARASGEWEQYVPASEMDGFKFLGEWGYIKKTFIHYDDLVKFFIKLRTGSVRLEKINKTLNELVQRQMDTMINRQSNFKG